MCVRAKFRGGRVEINNGRKKKKKKTIERKKGEKDGTTRHGRERG